MCKQGVPAYENKSWQRMVMAKPDIHVWQVTSVKTTLTNKSINYNEFKWYMCQPNYIHVSGSIPSPGLCLRSKAKTA